jgi:acetyl esterase/lipase
MSLTVAVSLIVSVVLTVRDADAAPQAHAGEFCYLPTESNVAYSSITELPLGSPKQVLAYGNQRYQFAELWLPKIGVFPEQRAPLVVLVHGGCWLNSFDIRHTHALSTALAQSGYAVWSLEYRRTGDAGGGWPGSYEDIKSAIAYLPKLAEYSVDLDRVAIAGHSAGGHLALLAGADKLYDFNAVIGLAAIVDLEKYSYGKNSCQLATRQFMGGAVFDVPKAYQAANPAKKNLPHTTVLLHGERDTIVPTEHSTSTDVRHRIIDDAGHFDMIHPGTQAFQVLLQELAKAFSAQGS